MSIAQPTLKSRDFRTFRDLIYRNSGISLEDDKVTFLQSRLQKRLRATNLDSFSHYLHFLEHQDPEGVELQEMINRVTTNKTHFFREDHHFDHLTNSLFPELVAAAAGKSSKKKMRIWSAACSSGEEPYSIAMVIDEYFRGQPDWDIRILATDIDTAILDKAGLGIYHEDELDSLDRKRLAQHFSPCLDQENYFQANKPIRDYITYRQLNFADERWPINAKFDAIFCRNVMIYFDAATQDQLVRRLANYLTPTGRLIIGHSESIAATDVYRRTGTTIFQLNSAPPAAVQPPQAPAPKPAPAALPRKKIILGEMHASETPVEISTTLGSCVAACLYDEVSRVGGMNHFAMPDCVNSERTRACMGIHAMEMLVNDLLKMGAAKHRLKAKVFGAGKISKEMNGIGERNEAFIREFLETEKIEIVAEFLGADSGMKVLFEPTSGRAKAKLIDASLAPVITSMPEPTALANPDITLF